MPDLIVKVIKTKKSEELVTAKRSPRTRELNVMPTLGGIFNRKKDIRSKQRKSE